MINDIIRFLDSRAMAWFSLVSSLLMILGAVVRGYGDGWTLGQAAIAGFFFRELLIDRRAPEE